MQCLNASSSDIYTFACPSHGWEATQSFIRTSVNSFEPRFLAWTGQVDGPIFVQVTGHESLRRLTIADEHNYLGGYDPEPRVATIQQSIVADALTETGNLWLSAVSNVSRTGHGSVLQRQDAVHTINSGYYQPYTTASCANDVIRGPQDDSAVAFPLPPGVYPKMMLNQSKYNDSILNIYSFVYSGMIKDQIFETPGSLAESRLKWVELPQDPFNGSAIGAVVLLPRSTTNVTQEIIVCTLGAGWGSSLVNTSSFAESTTFTTSTADVTDVSLELTVNQSYPAVFHESQAESTAAGNIVLFYLPFFLRSQ